jgi:hypothetical protein
MTATERVPKMLPSLAGFLSAMPLRLGATCANPAGDPSSGDREPNCKLTIIFLVLGNRRTWFTNSFQLSNASFQRIQTFGQHSNILTVDHI